MPRERSFGPGPLLAKYLSLSGVPQGGVRGQTRLDGSRPLGEDGHISLFLVPTAVEDAVPPRWCRIPSSPCPVSLLFLCPCCCCSPGSSTWGVAPGPRHGWPSLACRGAAAEEPMPLSRDTAGPRAVNVGLDPLSLHLAGCRQREAGSCLAADSTHILEGCLRVPLPHLLKLFARARYSYSI